MKKLIQSITMALSGALLLAACEKKPLPDTGTGGPDPSGMSTVKLEFFSKVGTANMVLGNQWYKNDFGDSFKVNAFNYYISNIKLNGTKGTYTETESYHVIKTGVDSLMSFDLKNVPYDTYNSMTVMIGVDSARNVSGAQTGALDPLHEMYWSWKTGYIMMKFEGYSPQSTGADNLLIFHIGGHAGKFAGQRTVTLNFPTPIKVSKDGINHVHVEADANALFRTPKRVEFSLTNIVMNIDMDSEAIANNYANMLSVSYSGL
jgi:hypothetical protein